MSPDLYIGTTLACSNFHGKQFCVCVCVCVGGWVGGWVGACVSVFE